MIFTCDHILGDFNSLAVINPATLGPFTPTWVKTQQLNRSNTNPTSDTSSCKWLKINDTYDTTVLSKLTIFIT